MLKTKSILAQKCETDGFRIAIMSRLTQNDGKTQLPKGCITSLHAWYRELAPPDRLVGDYYKRGLQWDEYEQRYLEHIRQPEIAAKVKDLAQVCLETTVTILCVEETPEHCHRRLLAEECRRYEPGLEVEIL